MPQLTIFTVCEKVIVDAKGIPSLINLFQRMDLQLQDTPLPEDAIAPGRWAIFSVWQLTAGEVGKDFIQHTRINKPDGTIFSEFSQPFRVESEIDMQAKTFVEIMGIPVGKQGRIQILTWLAGAEDDIHECHFYVQHLPKVEAAANAPLAAISSQGKNGGE
jgi:hypothetical protein